MIRINGLLDAYRLSHEHALTPWDLATANKIQRKLLDVMELQRPNQDPCEQTYQEQNICDLN
jgi:hypothetical protein